MRDMIETNKFRVYHVTNEGICSWYEFTKYIYEVANITNLKVNPITTKEYQSMVKQANRPLNSRMSKINLLKMDLVDYQIGIMHFVYLFVIN